MVDQSTPVKDKTMHSPRRIGAESSKTRAILLDAARQLMRDEGYAAVTSRRLATQAGLKPQLVHYYFRSMDDLFLALFQGIAEELYRKQEIMLAPTTSLREIWDSISNADDAILYVEFMAIANHRKPMRAAIGEFGNVFRRRQADMMVKKLAATSVDVAGWDPVAFSVMMETSARSLGFDALLGVTVGREETISAMNRLIDLLDNSTTQ